MHQLWASEPRRRAGESGRLSSLLALLSSDGAREGGERAGERERPPRTARGHRGLGRAAGAGWVDGERGIETNRGRCRDGLTGVYARLRRHGTPRRLRDNLHKSSRRPHIFARDLRGGVLVDRPPAVRRQLAAETGSPSRKRQQPPAAPSTSDIIIRSLTAGKGLQTTTRLQGIRQLSVLVAPRTHPIVRKL